MKSSNITQCGFVPTSTHPIDTCANCGANKCSDGKLLNRCARCRIQQYCSRECQKKHWPQHKAVCKDTLWKFIDEVKDSLTIGYLMGKAEYCVGDAIMVTPVGTNEVGYHITPVIQLPTEMLQSPGWARLPFSVAVGFPVRVIGTHADNGDLNELIDPLCFEPMHKSLRFGRSCIVPKPTGGMMVVRDDGGKIHIKHLVALVRYARVVLREIQEINSKKAEGDNDAKKKEIVSKWLNPKAFKEFFNELKEAGMAEEPMGWVEAECPVKGA